MQPKLTMHQLIGAMVRVVLTVQSVTRCACDRAGPRRPSWLSSSLVPHRSQPRMRIRVYEYEYATHAANRCYLGA